MLGGELGAHGDRVAPAGTAPAAFGVPGGVVVPAGTAPAAFGVPGGVVAPAGTAPAAFGAGIGSDGNDLPTFGACSREKLGGQEPCRAFSIFQWRLASRRLSGRKGTFSSASTIFGITCENWSTVRLE